PELSVAPSAARSKREMERPSPSCWSNTPSVALMMPPPMSTTSTWGTDGLVPRVPFFFVCRFFTNALDLSRDEASQWILARVRVFPDALCQYTGHAASASPKHHRSG